ncbi:hypothetical protein EVAR_28488_1 [Eumeta japonica]|uniref:Uncharacterized protein n=1 Tax=Eumeta variegata TaxID=151549 RepID=A0A4C1WNT4_EUMVA|nr:hypothetical protein EVAR_28488_1 [Eumeta japonica]
MFRHLTVQSTLYSFRMSHHEVIYNAYVKRYVCNTKKYCQEEVIKLWNAEKQRFLKEEDLVLNVHIRSNSSSENTYLEKFYMRLGEVWGRAKFQDISLRGDEGSKNRQNRIT